MRDEVVRAFHLTAKLSRSEVFDDDRLMPTSAVIDAATAAPGWVGADWMPGGTLLVAINPGGGGDKYRINPTDRKLYDAIRFFRDAPEPRQAKLMRRMSDIAIEVQASHNIRRVVNAVFDAGGLPPPHWAFLNVLPFRTREDKRARKAELQRAWRKATGRQVEALAPRRIVALGQKAYDAMLAAGADPSGILCLPRARGDNFITPKAQEALAVLRAERSDEP